MGSVGAQTWLQKLEEQLNVDVDWMDPTYSKNLQIKPNDQTSNNLWVNEQMSHPENKEMFAQVCKELKGDWKAAYTRIVSSLCLDVWPDVRSPTHLFVRGAGRSCSGCSGKPASRDPAVRRIRWLT